jgi:acetoacetyl-CoA synthetase
MTAEGDLLFTPTTERVERSLFTDFIRFVNDAGLTNARTYAELHAWSVESLGDFWTALADWGGVIWRHRAETPLIASEGAEHARWFPGAELNYVDHVLRHKADALAVIALDESGVERRLSYGEMAEAAGAAAEGLRRLGVAKGDRVAAVLPNGIEAIVGLWATASLGAIWSSCAPEFGAPSMTDRFRQIEPKVLLVADGYRYGGQDFPLAAKTELLAAALPGLAAVVTVPVLARAAVATTVAAGEGGATPRQLPWAELVREAAPLQPEAVAFDHPLWILYSSGTTGLPKPIVQGHGGIVLEHIKAVGLHSDLRAGDRFFWFSTTGWMMWNFLVGGLLCGTTIVAYDGSPVFPDQMALWRMAAEQGVTFFGTSAPFLEACRKAGLSPRAEVDLSAIHSVGSTGAPLTPEGFAWATTQLNDDVLVGSVSGGTDVCTGFLHACPLLPVHAGELQCAALGCAVEAFSTEGEPVHGEVGELVITAPMPSMPVALWGDADGSRLHASYFADFPGVWRHGDWVKRTERDSYVVYGRSDATLNRGGVRMGTAEFYRIIETIPGIADALVIDTTELGREGELILLVVTEAGTELAPLTETVRTTLRREVSPRHVPDRVIEVAALPRTLNGKKVEVPIRKILLGASPDKAVAADALADPGALEAVLASLRAAGLLDA